MVRSSCHRYGTCTTCTQPRLSDPAAHCMPLCTVTNRAAASGDGVCVGPASMLALRASNGGSDGRWGGLGPTPVEIDRTADSGMTNGHGLALPRREAEQARAASPWLADAPLMQQPQPTSVSHPNPPSPRRTKPCTHPLVRLRRRRTEGAAGTAA